MPRSSSAISLTAPIRRAISFRVKPSGKTMRRIGFGGAVSVAPVESPEAEPPPPTTPTPSAAQAISRDEAEADDDTEERPDPAAAAPSPVVRPHAGRALAFHCR